MLSQHLCCSVYAKREIHKISHSLLKCQCLYIDSCLSKEIMCPVKLSNQRSQLNTSGFETYISTCGCTCHTRRQHLKSVMLCYTRHSSDSPLSASSTLDSYFLSFYSLCPCVSPVVFAWVPGAFHPTLRSHLFP